MTELQSQPPVDITYPQSSEGPLNLASLLVTDSVYRCTFLNVIGTLLARGLWPADIAIDAQRMLREVGMLRTAEIMPRQNEVLLTEDEQAAYRDITRPYAGPPVTRRGH